MEKIINFDRYPLLELDSQQMQNDIQEYSEIFHHTGVCVLNDFLRPEAVKNLVAEATGLMPVAHHNKLFGNAYLDELDQNLPMDHARRLVDFTQVGAIAYDQIPTDSMMKRVYNWAPVTEFISSIINLGPLFHYDCTLGALNYGVMKEGEKLRWHFDQSDFVVSLPLQPANDGGVFEFVHNIRSPQEENYDRVKDLLLGDSSNVQCLVAKPGSLVFFQGRYTIHRVTEVNGSTPRIGALLGYADRPGVTSSEYLKKIRYGRVG